MKVKIKFTHAIAPSAKDVQEHFLEDIWTSFEPRTWARCLRFVGALPKGVSIREMRRDTDPETGLDRVVVFPHRGKGACVWHSLAITKIPFEVGS